jgi:peptide deformylase
MAILKIARMGNPALRSPAQTVEDAAHPAIRALVSDMVETMLDAGGVGLAAPQVHVPLRIVIFHLPAARTGAQNGAEAEGDGEDEDAGALHVFINPVITPIGDEQSLDWEGCLSVPGMRGVVPRFNRVRYEATGLDGNPIEGEAEGFHARVIQHECDHLDGMLYPMRVRDLSLFGFNAEWDRHPIGLPGAGDDDDAPQGGAA